MGGFKKDDLVTFKDSDSFYEGVKHAFSEVIAKDGSQVTSWNTIKETVFKVVKVKRSIAGGYIYKLESIDGNYKTNWWGERFLKGAENMIKNITTTIYICDICGKEVEKLAIKPTETMQTVVKIQSLQWYGNVNDYDICPDCNRKIIKFLQTLGERND